MRKCLKILNLLIEKKVAETERDRLKVREYEGMIKRHVEKCPDCRAFLEGMREKTKWEEARNVKIYKGKHSGKVESQSIIVQDNADKYPLEHIERHSPDGFNWGYGGSEPADTALSILTDCLGMDLANRLYQLFKWKIVAGWGEEWSIGEERIREWVKSTVEGRR